MHMHLSSGSQEPPGTGACRPFPRAWRALDGIRTCPPGALNKCMCMPASPKIAPVAPNIGPPSAARAWKAADEERLLRAIAGATEIPVPEEGEGPSYETFARAVGREIEDVMVHMQEAKGHAAMRCRSNWSSNRALWESGLSWPVQAPSQRPS